MQGRGVTHDNPARLCMLHTRSVLDRFYPSSEDDGWMDLLQAKATVWRGRAQGSCSAACVALSLSGPSVLCRV